MSNDNLHYLERKLSEWMERIKTGRVALPTFQRSYVWDITKIKDLLDAFLKNRPVGTLLLISDNDERFLSRPIKGMPDIEHTDPKELILDGQQRLTALWNAFHHDPQIFVKIRNWNHDPLQLESVLTLTDVGIRKQKDKDIDPAILYEKKCFPFGILGIDGVTQDDEAGWKWCNAAKNNDGEAARKLWGKIDKNLGEHLRSRGLWYLTLGANMSRKDAIDVYVKTNQSSAVIKKFDITVAIYDIDSNASLRDEIINMVEGLVEEEMLIRRFFDPDHDNSDHNDLIPKLGELLLKVACLRADLPPTIGHYTNQKILDILRNNKADFRNALAWTLKFYTQEGILGRRFVPSDVPLRVLPALHPIANKKIVHRKYLADVERVIRSYLWRSFLTHRYSQNANTRLLEDYREIRNALMDPKSLRKKNLKDIAPIFNEDNFPFPSFDDLSNLDNPLPNPKLKNTIARGVFAISLRRGHDFLTNEPITKNANSDWQYHHLFPKRYLRNHHVNLKQINHCLNLSLITEDTNGLIGKQPPHIYLGPDSKLHYKTGNNPGRELKALVETHVIPFDELSSKPNNELGNSDVERIYRTFIQARARMMEAIIKKLANGIFPEA